MESSYYKLVDYNEENLDYLFEIHKENFKKFFESHYGKWNDKRQKKSFANMMKSGFYKMIEFRGEIVGAISFEKGVAPHNSPESIGKPTVLWYINIDKRRHGQGLGSVILRDLITECDFRLQLKVYKDNLHAIDFYRKHGLHCMYFESDKDFYVLSRYTASYTRRNTGAAVGDHLMEFDIQKHTLNHDENS